MNFLDAIVLIFVLSLIFLVLFFNIKSLKNKDKCSNCPYAKKCIIREKQKEDLKKDCDKSIK